MTIVLYGLATFAVIFGGGILGLLFGRVLPEEYRSDATQNCTNSDRNDLITCRVGTRIVGCDCKE